MISLRAARRLLLSSALLAALLGVPTAASAATMVAAWNFTPSGQVVADSAGTPQNLTLSPVSGFSTVPGLFGSAVSFNTATTYGTTSGGNSNFNPGANEFAVTVRFRTTRIDAKSSPNLAQHGLFADAGQYKVQLNPKNGGIAQCRMKGTGGDRLLDGPVLNVDDGLWHVVTCWRTSAGIGITVDGVTATDPLALGSVSAARPFVVANKSANGGALDQFFGELDCVQYATGAGAQALTETATAC